MVRRALPLLALALCLLGGPGPAAGERLKGRVAGTIRLMGDPDGLGAYRIVRAFPNLRFRKPLYLGAPPDGSNRIFVLEQDGIVRWFENRRDVRESHVALDISHKTYRRHSEEGLLGLAFHPDFKRNRTLFLHYSANNPRRGVVSRFQMSADRTKVRPRTERVILEQPQPWGNHNGGGLEFGPDGYLYVTFGDGGAANDPRGAGQDLGTWLGSLLRIDVDKARPYAVPKDNPFVSVRGARPEIWAYGLRNVWRFSFDRLTGTCWGGDVGQVDWEEIDVIVKGGNYGWNRREGPMTFRKGHQGPLKAHGPLIEPVISHDRRDAKSITGGYVYRGTRLPGLVGAYLYADYVTTNLWALRWDGTKVTSHRLIGRGSTVSSFGEDERGEVYWTAFDGRIYTLAQGGGTEIRHRFPRRLSQTGLFTNIRGLVPHAALVPYSVNVPLWSDGGAKARYVMLPGTERVKIDARGRYQFPRGTIFVKTFLAGQHRLETRLLVHRKNGWAGFTYVWNEAQDDALLIDERVDRALPGPQARATGSSHWTFPGRADCMTCHTSSAGFVLGFRSEQLDRAHDYGAATENQLDAFRRIGLFDGNPRTKPAWPDWSDKGADAGQQARAYLDVNCAFCHMPGGSGNAKIDLRFDTPLERAFLLNEAPGQGDLGVRGAVNLKPGIPAKSLLYLRMQRTDGKGMPNLAHNAVDEEALAHIARWIRSLK